MNSAGVAKVISRNYGQTERGGDVVLSCRETETIKGATFYWTVEERVGDEVS